ncbi:hypothetical protein [Corallococcus sp. EGB]|uniref:hypothetical protein n=1 Tax=Corallococcus sp. EGB TaxID=1521117 RepID=UPI001CBF3AEA|nr:hypothetical protein [Corallococcus sp. EGB]
MWNYLAIPTELNPWLYARDNPLLFTDPTGESSFEGYPGHVSDSICWVCFWKSTFGDSDPWCDSGRAMEVALEADRWSAELNSKVVVVTAGCAVAGPAGCVKGLSLGFGMGFVSDMGQQTYANPNRVTYWDQIDYARSWNAGINGATLGSAGQALGAAGTAGELTLSVLGLVGAYAGIHEGGTQMSYALQQGDFGRGLYGLSNITLGVVAAHESYRTLKTFGPPGATAENFVTWLKARIAPNEMGVTSTGYGMPVPGVVDDLATSSQPVLMAGSKSAQQELRGLGRLEGRSAASIERDLEKRGFSSTEGRGGGKVWTKEMPKGQTAVVRIDPATERTPPRGYADEVPHAHKEIVPTAETNNRGNFSNNRRATTLDDDAKKTTDPARAHIPIQP